MNIWVIEILKVHTDSKVKNLNFIESFSKYMYAVVQLLIQFELMKMEKSEFSNSLSITWLWVVRKLTFDRSSLVLTGSKVSFGSISKGIKSGFSKKLSPMIINFEKKFEWIKTESACICFTWLTSFTYFTGSKVGPPRNTPKLFRFLELACWKLFSSWIGSWICCFRFAFFLHRGNLEDPYQSFFYFVNCQNGFDPKLYNFSLKALSFESYTRFDFMSTQFIHTIFKITPPKIAKFTWIWVIRDDPYNELILSLKLDRNFWRKFWN